MQTSSEGGRATVSTYTVVGALLGLGAPLGFLALRTVLMRRVLRRELRTERSAYTYMTITTPIVFGALAAALGRRHEKLRSAHEQIDRMHEEFLSIAAHDLRSPISAMVLQLDLMRSGAKDRRVSVPIETIERLQKSVGRLSSMVGQLFDATRIEAGKLRLDLVPTNLPDSVSSVLELLRQGIRDHSIELAIEGSPPVVMADATRLDEIITNLVENAAKYSPAGTPIHVEVHAQPAGALLQVRDHGWGIAADECPRIFERYYQTKRARQKKTGLGLGLYITKGLVEAHGGTITVESGVDRGSTFSIWLPAARGAAS